MPASHQERLRPSLLMVLLTGAVGLSSLGPAGGRAAAQTEDGTALKRLLRVHVERTRSGSRLVLEGSAEPVYDYASTDARSLWVELHETLGAQIEGRLDATTDEIESVVVAAVAAPGTPPRLRIQVTLSRPLIHQVYTRGNDLHLLFTRLPGEPTPRTAEAPAPPSAPAPTPTPPPAPVVPAGQAQVPVPAPATQTPAAGPQPEEPADILPAVEAASRLLRVEVGTSDEGPEVRLHSNGPLQYQDAYVEELPIRLMLDLRGIINDVRQYRLDVGDELLASVRVAQFSVEPLITRVVMDLSRRVAYTIEPHTDGITIRLAR